MDDAPQSEAATSSATATPSLPAQGPHVPNTSSGVDLTAIAAVVALLAALIIPIFFLLRSQGSERKKKVCGRALSANG